jgi:hypothetical protein
VCVHSPSFNLLGPTQQNLLRTQFIPFRNKLECFSLFANLFLRHIFAGKVRSVPAKWSPIGGSTWVATILFFKYQTRLEVTDSGKQSSLLQYEINCDRKKFYSSGPSVANDIKPFSLSLTWRSNKLECLSPTRLHTVVFR